MPEKTEYQGKRGRGGSDAKVRNLEIELSQCAVEMEKMRYELSCFMRDQGLATALYATADQFKEIFAPLKALATVRTLGDEQHAIAALRTILARPNFDAPPTDFGRVFQATGSYKGETAS